MNTVFYNASYRLPIAIPIASAIISFLSNVPFFKSLSQIISLETPITAAINAAVHKGRN